MGCGERGLAGGSRVWRGPYAQGVTQVPTSVRVPWVSEGKRWLSVASRSAVCPRINCVLSLRARATPRPVIMSAVMAGGPLPAASSLPAESARALLTNRCGTGRHSSTPRISQEFAPCVPSFWHSALVSWRSARLPPKHGSRPAAADRSFIRGGPRSSCTGQCRRSAACTFINASLPVGGNSL